MLFKLGFLFLLLLGLAGLFLFFAPLFFFSDSNLVQPALFFCLNAGFLFAIEVESVGTSFGDDNLSRDIITSSDSLITN